MSVLAIACIVLIAHPAAMPPLQPAVRPSFYVTAEASKPLDSLKSGDEIRIQLRIANGSVYGIKTLMVALEPEPGLQVLGSKVATFRKIAGNGGAVSTSVRVRLTAPRSALTVKCSAEYQLDGGTATERKTFEIGGLPASP